MKRIICTAILLASPAAFADGAATFAATCSPCHGPGGKGDGPAAAALPVKPADFSQAAFWSSRTDDQLKKVIKEGGPSIGKNAAMAPNPQLSDAQISEIIAYMKTLKK